MPSTIDASFVDTNVLLYFVSADPAERAKAAVSRELIDEGRVVVSIQVLQEFYVQATRSTRTGALTHTQAVAFIESWLRFPVQDQTVALMRAALVSRSRFQITYWDAAIIEAARLQGCRTVLSEDLSHGQDYDGVRVENPFR